MASRLFQKENKVLRSGLDSLVCLSDIQGLKLILKKMIIKDMNVKGKGDKKTTRVILRYLLPDCI